MKSIEELQSLTKELREDILTTVHGAKSGHPGGSLSAIDILTVLFFDEMNYDPAHPEKPDRDRFILSKGHATPGYYSVLSKAGFFPKSELATFRKLESRLTGHPHPKIPGVEIATGSLGQGLSVGNGMAMCAKLDNLPYKVFVLMGDGELQEGQVWEAAMTAGFRRLNNIVAIVDHNKLAQDSSVSELKDIEPIDQKFKAFGWHTIRIDGHDIADIKRGFEEARSIDKPVVIIASTIKGKGVSFMENQLGWHGKAPNDEQLQQALAEVRNG